jgi:hypothetical protein
VKSVRFAAASLLAAGLIGVSGCGGSGGVQFAPVSGYVTLDGKPYDNAVVVFQPIASKGNMNPGMGSSGYTNAEGWFSLKCMDGRNNGAVVGKHIVQIMTKGNNIIGEDIGTGSPDGVLEAPTKANVNAIPAEWGADSKKEFDVQPGGTAKANFDIISTKAKKK